MSVGGCGHGALQDRRRLMDVRSGRGAAHRGGSAVQRLHVRRGRLVHGARLSSVRSRIHAVSASTGHRYVAAAIYANFFTHHWIWDLRWLLLVAVVLLWARTVMYARVWRAVIRMPLLLAFGGVAVFIYLAENIGTWAGAWMYPDQLDGWQPVSITKLVSWFLLMIISVVLVAWVYPPRPPTAQESVRRRVRAEEIGRT